MYFNDRHKLIVINHREQKSFNVAMIKYKNSSIYIQKQINRLFRVYRKFVKIYIDDIIIFSRILEKHVIHLRQIFEKLVQFNIFIKLIKTFIDYSFVQLLDQKMNFFDLFINEKKLKTISKLQFSRIFRQLKTYLNLIDWLKKYVSYYVDVSKVLQKRKTILLKFFLRENNARKTFASRTRVDNLTLKEIVSFQILQFFLSKFIYLIHHNVTR